MLLDHYLMLIFLLGAHSRSPSSQALSTRNIGSAHPLRCVLCSVLLNFLDNHMFAQIESNLSYSCESDTEAVVSFVFAKKPI